MLYKLYFEMFMLTVLVSWCFRTLANYMVYTTLAQLLGYMGKDFVDKALILDKAQSGVKGKHSTWTCVS